MMTTSFIYGLQGEMLLPSGLKPWFKRLETARLKPRPFKNPICETRSRDRSRTSGRAAQIQGCGWAAGAGLFGAASSCCVWPFWTESMLPWSEPGLRSKLSS
jgi:hypothetical protein